jgi:type IV pilus assembly protein PilB
VSELGEIQLIERLIQSGKLDVDGVADFIAEAVRKHESVTTHALTSMLAGEEDLAAVTAELFNMEAVVLSKTPIEEEIALLISAENANAWRVLPYGRDSLGNLLVAISDPKDKAAQDNLKRALPREEILYHFALDAELSQALDTVYRDAASTAGIRATLAEIAKENQHEEHLTVRDADSGIIRLVNSIIHQASREDASDIHIEPQESLTNVRFRVDGILRAGTQPLQQGDITTRVIARIKTISRLKPDEKRRPQDGRVTLSIGGRPLDLRVVTVPTIYGEQVTMRLLDQRRAMLSLEALGMTADNLARYEAAINRAHGCCIITGPTGSGKSTTLYSSALRVVTSERKFISIEDPVEYRLPGITQIDVSGYGEQAMTFSSALRAVLRSDPDIILVGEIRDEETARTAIEAALTGHFLYSTLHTNDALSAVSRLLRLKIEPFLTAEAVAVLVAQRLVRRLCEDCKVPYEATPQYLRDIMAPQWALEHNEPMQLFKAREGGCEACRKQGYRGRTGVHEVVTMSEELKALIIASSPQEELTRYVRAQGMHSLRDDAFIKVANGTTSMEELARVVL